MSVDNISHQHVRIKHGVIVLLSIVLLSSLTIFFLTRYQSQLIIKDEYVLNDYHLSISKRGLEILRLLDIERIWLKSYSATPESISAGKKELPIYSISSKLYLRDRLEAFRHQISVHIKDISDIHHRFHDLVHDGNIDLLLQAYKKFEVRVSGLKERLIIHEGEVDYILNPLASLVHQVQRLHDNSYFKLKKSLGESREKTSVQINLLIVSIVLVGVAILILLLVYLNRLMSDMVVIQNDLAKHKGRLEELVSERTRELQNTQEALIRKERLAALGQLTATVSHELRNPLAAMRPFLYLIRKKIGLEDNQLTQAVERLDRNVTRCDHIIDELLDFTRITGMELETVVLDDWLTGVLSEQAIHPDIRFIQTLSLGGCGVEIDVNRLRRGIINVIDNACHAMQEENDPDQIRAGAELTIETTKESGRIEIRIKDTGIGIPEDELQKIFEPLYSNKSFGVGLGMSIIKQIMEQHGGGVEVTSEQGKGTTVTLWLQEKIAREGRSVA